MKKFLLQLSLFLTIILAIISLLNIFHSRHNNEPPHYKLQYTETTNSQSKYNSIIIGTSMATHGIRPSQLDTSERRYYNLALNGTTPDFYLKWLNNLFNVSHPKVDYWIVSTDLFFLSGAGWRDFEQDSEFFPSKNFWEMLMNNTSLDKSLLVSNRLPLIKYRSRVLNSFENHQGAYEFIVDEYDRGYITLKRNDKVDFSKDVNYTIKITEDAKSKYTELIDSLLTLGGEIIIIIPPVFSFLPEQYIQAKIFLEVLSKEKNIPLYDFNDEIFDDKLQSTENFVDFIHLSGKGSKIFSSLLKQRINARTHNNVYTK
ncbi:MAG: hypothetical protein ACFB0B_02280 [Thermonemataceae bacterium]